MQPITEIADKMGLDREAVIPYGKYKAKVHWTRSVRTGLRESWYSSRR